MKKVPKSKIKISKAKSRSKAEAYVTREMNVGEVAWRYPVAAEILEEAGLHCIGCIGSSFDTVETGCKLHGLTDKQIDDILKQINREIKKDN